MIRKAELINDERRNEQVLILRLPRDLNEFVSSSDIAALVRAEVAHRLADYVMSKVDIKIEGDKNEDWTTDEHD